MKVFGLTKFQFLCSALWQPVSMENCLVFLGLCFYVFIYLFAYLFFASFCILSIIFSALIFRISSLQLFYEKNLIKKNKKKLKNQIFRKTSNLHIIIAQCPLFKTKILLIPEKKYKNQQRLNFFCSLLFPVALLTLI